MFPHVRIARIRDCRCISTAPESIFMILRRVRDVSRYCDRRVAPELRGSGIVPRVRLSWYFHAFPSDNHTFAAVSMPFLIHFA